MNRPVRLAALIALPSLVMAAGCSADMPLNPSFPLTLADARRDLDKMRTEPRELERPVLVLGGLFDPGVFTEAVARELRRVTDDRATVLTVSFTGAADFEACRRRALDAIDAALVHEPAGAPPEIDVIGISMGGLVARTLCEPNSNDPRRVRVRRLFSIGTPHRGARLAALPTLDQRVLQMRVGSPLLERLDSSEPDAKPAAIVPYVRLGDAIVGPDRAAPPGRNPWWVANVPFSPAHLAAPLDARILADIARRIRGEQPYTRHPPSPLPGTASTP